MLVLTRKLDESIIVDEQIEVKIVEIKDNTVKLGITAPRHIQIFRKEIFEEIKKSNLMASESSPDTLPKLSGKIPPETKS